jgi:hypothetical protein
MAFVHGRLGEFTYNSVVLSTFCDNLEIGIDVDTAEVTTFGDAWKEFIAGLAGATITISGSWDPTTTSGPASAITSTLGTAPKTFIAEPGGAAVTQHRTGSCICTSYSETASVSDRVTFSADFLVTGAVTFES